MRKNLFICINIKQKINVSDEINKISYARKKYIFSQRKKKYLKRYDATLINSYRGIDSLKR